MQFSLLSATLLLSVAAAQITYSLTSGSSTSTACSGQSVLDACYGSTLAIANSCGSTDYNCLCSKWNDVLTCFGASGCTNDARQASVLSSKDTYCNDASVYTSASSSVPSAYSAPASTTTGSSLSKNTEAGTVATKTSSKSGSTATSSGTTATNTDSGANKIVGAGSVMIGLAGLIGALL